LLSQSTRGDHPPFVILDGLPDTLSSTPVVGDARTGPGFALLASGKYSEGIAWLSQDHQGQAGGDASTTHFAQAQIAEAENRVSDARREYAAALNGTLAGRSPIYVAIGRLAQVEGDLPAATDALTRAVQLNPNDATMRQELATAYAAQGRTEDAFVELVAGLLVDPANASLHAAVGQLRLDSGHPDEAVPSFVRALDLNPSRYEVRYALATALTRLGRTDEARRQLEIFDRVRRQMLEQRRQGIQNDVEKEDSIRRGLPNPGGNR
jgi:tetratricopeptide (TPR) repeat protein